LLSVPIHTSRPRRAAFSFLETFMTDPKSDAEIMYPNQQASKDWKIELRYLPIAHRGHGHGWR
jgi:hypothetical protein